MASIINTNSLSLLTQNNLNTSQSSLNTAIQRLSSGLRINSAKDDAAGQAIANRFTASITGLTQATRNANDGISLSQTTEGALNEINNNLQRIRELAVQSANGSNSAADKTSIQAEISQRMQEIDRTSQQTDFNGTKVLATTQDLKIQVGANDGQTIAIGLKQIDVSTLGLTGFSVSGNTLKVGAALASFTTGNTPPTQNTDLSAAAAALTKATGKAVVASDLSLHEVQNTAGTGTGQFVVQSGSDYYAASKDISAASTGGVTLNTVDVSYADAANGITTGSPMTQAATLVKVGSDSTGAAQAFATVQGKNYSVDVGGLVSSGTATATTGTVNATPFELSAGSGVTATAQYAGGASADPMAIVDAAIKTVDTLRGSLGAVQNRFDSVISNLGATVTNLSSSRSRIQDANYATEVSNMTRAQILQQAGTSVLAKANQSTQGVMTLLQ